MRQQEAQVSEWRAGRGRTATREPEQVKVTANSSVNKGTERSAILEIFFKSQEPKLKGFQINNPRIGGAGTEC